MFRKNNTIASPFLVAGSVFVFAGGLTSLSSTLKQADALNEGQILSSSTSGLGLALLGLTCVVVSVPFSISAKKHLNKSIDNYNSSIVNAGRNPVEIELMVHAQGLGLQIKF